MPNDIAGLPLHPLVVHATVVTIPVAALTVLLAVLWPRFRRWAGPLPAVLSLVGLALVPLSTSTGETLEKHVRETALVERHTELADGLLPWMIGLAVVAVAAYALHRREAAGRSLRPVVGVLVAVLALVAVVGTTVQVVRIGHSGAEAAWSDVDMNAPAGR
jgi:hypothetical protein